MIVRNADLVAPVRTMPDGRPYFGGAGANELNPDGGAGIYVLDNTSEGYNFNVTAQLRKAFAFGLSASCGLQLHPGQEQPEVHRDRERAVAEPAGAGRSQPARAQLTPSSASGTASWAAPRTSSPGRRAFRTSVGLFVEVAEGNRFAGAGGNRYSFVYSGDVNGDGWSATT